MEYLNVNGSGNDSSIFNTQGRLESTTTEKYKFIDTKLIADKFKSMGFNIDSVKKTKVRSGSKDGYQKHLVRLSNPNITSLHNDLKLQLIVTNSHDGKNGFKISLGFYRLVCSNGMMVGKTFDHVSIRHTGNVLEKIEYGVEKIVAQVKKLEDVLTKIKNTKLTEEQINSFQKESLKLRGQEYTNIDWSTRRLDDGGVGLFEVINRVQEDLVRGNSTATRTLETTNSDGNVVLLSRTRRMRPISSINKELEINTRLFDIALNYIAA